MKTQSLSGSYNDVFTANADLNFTYSYDKSNRLLKSEMSHAYKVANTYDKDGNLLTLKRYDGITTLEDDFNYSYFSGTSKVSKVTGSTSQYTYDLNGNMTSDYVNKNIGIQYDYRNLITQLRHFEDSIIYEVKYYYDEAGNRIRKKVYQYNGTYTEEDQPVFEDNSSNWSLVRDEIYVRGADGKDLAIYESGTLTQWNIFGLSNEGKIDAENNTYFYLKDHLGSIRAVVNDKGDVKSAQDYDCWGYLLTGRTFESQDSKYKFTEKERDEENKYDYFGARYYDARIGRWGSVEPQLDKYVQFTPFNYSLNNPLNTIDPNGRDPYRRYLGSVNQVVEILNRNENQNKSYWQLSEIFANNKDVRYIYTKAGGFIDLRHFFAAAFISSFKGKNAALVLGELIEKRQSITGSKSTDNPEDRPSNLQGAFFGEEYKNRENVSQNFLEFIEKLKPVDPKDESISPLKIYIPYDETSIPLQPRISYEPYFGEDPDYPNQYRRGEYEP